MMVYLAGPIDDIGLDISRGWRDQASRLLAEQGVVTFSPPRAFTCPPLADEIQRYQVTQVNRRAIEMSDLVIANLSGAGRGFGTIREIEYARAQGIPVVVWGPAQLARSYETWDVEITIDLDSTVQVAIRYLRGRSDEDIS